jgi:hypothetical protein
VEDETSDEKLDAAMISMFDATGADTAGWPMQGNVVPPPCVDPGNNEDGDDKPDSCDNCPMDFNQDQKDGDTDGIGDICDPFPMFAVHRLVHFDGFNSSVAATGKTIGGVGDYVIADSRLRQRNAENRTLFVFTEGPWKRPVVQIRMSNVQRTAQVNAFYAGVYLIPSQSPPVRTPNGLYCKAKYGNESPELWLQRMQGTEAVDTAIKPFVPVSDDTVTLVLSSEQLETVPHCDGERADKPLSELFRQVVIPSSTTDPEPAFVGVATENTTASFHAIAIYETTYPL